MGSPSLNLKNNASPNKMYRLDIDQMMFKEYNPLKKGSLVQSTNSMVGQSQSSSLV